MDALDTFEPEARTLEARSARVVVAAGEQEPDAGVAESLDLLDERELRSGLDRVRP